jgi:hypothetical protein
MPQSPAHQFRRMNSLLKELEKQISTFPVGEVITIQQNSLGLFGIDRKNLILWFDQRGFEARFIEETRSIEAKKICR